MPEPTDIAALMPDEVAFDAIEEDEPEEADADEEDHEAPDEADPSPR